MKLIKISIILINLILGFNVQAITWKEFAKGPAGVFFYDPDSITGDMNAKKMVVKFNLATEQKDGILSRYTEYSVDCSNKSYFISNSVNYTSPDLQGTAKINPQPTQPIFPKPQTIGERLLEVACNSNVISNDKWIEIRTGSNDNYNLFKVHYGELSGNDSIKRLATLTNFTDKNGVETSRKISILINCGQKELFYVSDTTFDRHWATGNAKVNEIKPQRYPLDKSREERNIACSSKFSTLDQNVVKEWDLKDKAIGSKSRTQILEEYKFKWSNGKIFSMDEVGKMMQKCAGYSISLYELPYRMSILQSRGGKEFLTLVDAARGEQVKIINKLYGEETSNEMISRAATLMGMMLKNPGGLESNSKEAKDCLVMTKTATEMLDLHYKKIPPIN